MAGPVAAGVCVVLIAVAIAFAGSQHGNGGAPAGGGTGTSTDLNSLVGKSWRLESVQQAGHDAVAIPSNLGASVTFDRGGSVSAQDGVNYYGGKYAFTASGQVVITDVSGTLAGYAGDDPVTLAAIDGISALLYGPDSSAGTSSSAAQIDGNRVDLTAGDYTLVLGDAVPVAESSAAPPSSTTTA